MIRQDKHDRALEAINAVLVYARMMAASRCTRRLGRGAGRG